MIKNPSPKYEDKKENRCNKNMSPNPSPEKKKSRIQRGGCYPSLPPAFLPKMQKKEPNFLSIWSLSTSQHHPHDQHSSLNTHTLTLTLEKKTKKIWLFISNYLYSEYSLQFTAHTTTALTCTQQFYTLSIHSTHRTVHFS